MTSLKSIITTSQLCKLIHFYPFLQTTGPLPPGYVTSFMNNPTVYCDPKVLQNALRISFYIKKENKN